MQKRPIQRHTRERPIEKRPTEPTKQTYSQTHKTKDHRKRPTENKRDLIKTDTNKRTVYERDLRDKRDLHDSKETYRIQKKPI